MYRLDEPLYLYLLLLIPLLVVVYLGYRRWQRRSQRAFGQSALLQRLVPDRSQNKGFLKLLLSLVVVGLLSLALANPQMGTRTEKMERKGVDLVFALDVSLSMEARDVAPSRLVRAKEIISRTIDRLVSDRIGIITYAFRAYPQLPITTDYGAARLFLENVSTDMASVQGTALLEAVEMAVRYYDDKPDQSRLLFFLSDGENHEGSLEEAIQLAREEDIQIYSMGLGTAQGSPIPLQRNGRRIGYKKDQQGDVVITRLEEGQLRRLAESSGGKYRQVGSIQETARWIEGILKKQDQQTFDAQVYADYEDQFQWVLAPALLLLILEVFLLHRKTHWFRQLRLFDRHE